MSTLSSQQFEYHYDETGYYAYILMNGSHSICDAVKQRLKKIRLQVLHSGRSYRLANNQRKYQWFIRVYDPDQIKIRQGKPSHEVIERFFEAEFSVYSAHKLVTLLEEERLRAAKFQERLTQAERERQKYLEDAVQYVDLVEGTDTENTQLKGKLASMEMGVASLRAQIEQSQANLDNATKELDLRRALIATSDYVSFKQEMAGALRCLLPDIEFLQGSTDVLASEVKDYKPVLRLLHRLQHEPGTVKAEAFEGAPAWRELHYGGDGRLYFKRTSDGKYQVLISFKKYQRADGWYLKGLGKG
jgi:hypothetical protein